MNNSAIQNKFQLTLKTQAIFFQKFGRSDIKFFLYKPKCTPLFFVYLQIRGCYDFIARGKHQFTAEFKVSIKCNFPHPKKLSNILFFLSNIRIYKRYIDRTLGSKFCKCLQFSWVKAKFSIITIILYKLKGRKTIMSAKSGFFKKCIYRQVIQLEEL